MPVDLEEEARAQLWRDQRQRRFQYQLGVWEGLAGSPAARRALQDAHQPLIDYLDERRLPEDDLEREIDPLSISDQTNVGL